MSDNPYSNFVRPSLPTPSVQSTLSGEDAKRIYLEEIREDKESLIVKTQARYESRTPKTAKQDLDNVSKKDLFMTAQNNDVNTLKQILDVYPDMLNTTDDFGWSLLMIACQANSVDAVKELMKRGIDTLVRDRAGNSAQSLVIKNRNFILADVLLSFKSTKPKPPKKNRESTIRTVKSRLKKSYFCFICDKEFPDKEEHLSSTVHNIDVSKGKKIPSSFAIPETNKGYQIMLKVGWDKESGLGPDGMGKKYPIKTVQKQDKKGLGLDKRKKKIQEERKESDKHVNRKLLEKEYKSSRNLEINFRRQFY